MVGPLERLPHGGVQVRGTQYFISKRPELLSVGPFRVWEAQGDVNVWLLGRRPVQDGFHVEAG